VIVDLHAHYPMHLVPRPRVRVWRLLWSRGERRRLRDLVRALLVALASLFANYRSPFSGPRVQLGYLQAGGVGVALSVLYSFFDEIDVVGGIKPGSDYPDTLMGQLDLVERELADDHAAAALVAHDPAELAARGDKVAFIHAVEGGFHLGADPAQVAQSIERLAARGVAYVTLAHLIWREVATDAPALPFLTDEEYRKWLPQPAEGLSELGRAAIEAMVREHVLIDVSHMSGQSLSDTFELLDRLDPDRSVPVLATHGGFRFGSQQYMLDAPTLQQIAARDGLVGLIFARHQLEDGLSTRRGAPFGRARFERSFDVLCRHIDAIHDALGSHRHTAIGADFDGFIKPTLPGLEDMRDMARLERALLERYDSDGELICSANALRVLGYWRGGSRRDEGAAES
jgi:microsomal dipeptidase-like Zn-dependent dipeptidase